MSSTGRKGPSQAQTRKILDPTQFTIIQTSNLAKNGTDNSVQMKSSRTRSGRIGDQSCSWGNGLLQVSSRDHTGMMGGVPSPPHLAQTFVTRVSAVVRVLEAEHKQSSVWSLWSEGAKLIVFFGRIPCVADAMWERSWLQGSSKSPVQEASCFHRAV